MDLPSNSFWCPIDKNYKSVGVCRDSCPKSKNDTLSLHEFSCSKIFYLVCRLSSGSACNVFGTNNCSVNQCYCKTEYEGNLCEKCNWREFSFAYNGIDKTIDEISGYGVACQLGNFYFLVT